MRTIRIIVPAIFFLSLHSAVSQELPREPWRTLEGKEIIPGELPSKGPTLVNFWALWCAPCKLEMRALRELHEKYSDTGFSIIAVNEDSPRSLAKVRSYVAGQQLKFHIVPDPNGRILERMNVSVLPHSLLYDRSGNLVYSSTGYKPGDEKNLEDAIRKTLEPAE